MYHCITYIFERKLKQQENIKWLYHWNEGMAQNVRIRKIKNKNLSQK